MLFAHPDSLVLEQLQASGHFKQVLSPLLSHITTVQLALTLCNWDQINKIIEQLFVFNP